MIVLIILTVATFLIIYVVIKQRGSGGNYK